MWDILRQSLVTSPETDDLTGISDLDLLLVDGVWSIFATTRGAAGVTVLTVDANSFELPQTGRSDTPEGVLFPATASQIITVGGENAIVSTGRNPTLLPAYQVDSNGFGDELPLLTDPFQTNLLAVRRFEMLGIEYLITSSFADRAIRLYENDQVSGLTMSDSFSLVADVEHIAVAMVGSDLLFLATTEGSDAIETFAISENGTLELVSEGGPELEVGVAGITALETVVVGAKTFALVTAFGSSSLSVLEVTSTGDLIPTDHIIDRLDTRFSRASELKVLRENDRTLILLAGNDDGFTLLELLPHGRLILRAVISDATDTTLDNVSGIELFLRDDALHVFAASESEPGITYFTVDVGTFGQTVAGNQTGEGLIGGADNDVIHGAAGDDTLNGGAGDDVLSDGEGSDELTGGSGRDIFVLTQDGVTDRILDFEPGIDALDFSLFDFLFSVQDLELTPTTFGATVAFRDEITEIYRNGGGTLELEDLGGENILPLSHGVLPSVEVIPPQDPESPVVTTSFQVASTRGPTASLDDRDSVDYGSGGTGLVFRLSNAGDDTISGSDGNDTLNGGTGDDTIDGGRGNDLLIGGAGADTFVFASGADRISDFDEDFDTVRLGTSLWDNSSLTVQEIIEVYGIFSGPALILDFRDGDRLIVSGAIAEETIADHIVF